MKKWKKKHWKTEFFLSVFPYSDRSERPFQHGNGILSSVKDKRKIKMDEEKRILFDFPRSCPNGK